VIAIIYYRNWL